MDFKTTYRLLRRAFDGFVNDKVMTLSAALSFYMLLSFAPLLILVMWLVSSLEYGSQATILTQLEAVAGAKARQAAEAVLNSAQMQPSVGSIAGLLSILVSLVGATTVFAQLQMSLNRIWGIESKPGKAVWQWLRRRVLSIGLIGALVFISIVSLVISSALGLVLSQGGAAWDLLNQLISIAIYAGLFALLFRYLADVQLEWHRAAWGGLVTSILFVIGKGIIGYYLARGDVGGAYGAAGSLVVLLVWVYYSSAIFFFGAELVQAWFDIRGESIKPAEYAVKSSAS